MPFTAYILVKQAYLLGIILPLLLAERNNLAMGANQFYGVGAFYGFCIENRWVLGINPEI